MWTIRININQMVHQKFKNNLNLSLYQKWRGFFQFYKNLIQMSTLVVSSKCIEIQGNSVGVVNIKNAKINASAASFPILFKVKTNLKQLVDVRPSFGVLWPQGDKTTASLNVKYAGTQQQIDKAKLMVSWISTQEKKQFENRKFSHEQFNIFFNSAKKINEGSLILPIVFKENADKQRSQNNQSQQVSSRFSEESTVVKIEGSKTETIQEKVFFQSTKENQTNFQSVSSELSSKSSKIIEKPAKPGYSLKVLGLAVIIAFILGISAGIKFQRFIQPAVNQFTLKVSQIVQKYTTPQPEATSQNPRQTLQSANEKEGNKQSAVKAGHQEGAQTESEVQVVEETSEQIKPIEM